MHRGIRAAVWFAWLLVGALVGFGPILVADSATAGDDEGRSVLLAQAEGTADVAQAPPAGQAEPRQRARDTSKVEEIVVTARKVEETVQTVPIAVTAFSQDYLDRSFTRDLQDLSSFAPNVFIQPVRAGPQGAALSIRGISFADIEKSFDPAIGILIDGIYLGTNTQQLIDNFDFERVEVLRGPQGTLFGKNTIGGAINAVRTKPTGEFGLKSSVTYGRFTRNDYKLVANAPIVIDHLAAKVFFFSANDRGNSWNQFESNRQAQTDRINAGGALRWTPSDSVDVTLTYDYFKDDSETAALINVSRAFGTDPGVPVLPGSTNGDLLCTVFTFCDSGKRDSATLKSNTNFPMVSSLDGYAVTLNAEWDITPNFTLTAITGWRTTEEDVSEDFDAVPIDFFSTRREQDYDQLSQEIRLAGKIGDRFNFVGGLYYWWNQYRLIQNTFFLVDSLDSIGAIVPGVPDALPDGIVSFQDTDHETTSYAGFLTGHFHLLDNLRLNAGIRYTYEEKEIDNFLIGTITPGVGFVPTEFRDPPITGPIVAPNPFSIDDDWDEFTPTAGLDYEITEEAMVYFAWSRGFRSGGFNGRAGSALSVGPYDPEEVDNFEIGLKSDWFDNRLRLNLTGFYTTYDDKQEEVVVEAPAPLFQQTLVLNAAETIHRGGELELTAVPFEGFTFMANVGYLDSKYDDFEVELDPLTMPGVKTDFSDRELRRAPEWTIAATTRYVRDVGPGTADVIVQWRWTDEFHTTAQNYQFGFVDSWNQIDASIGYEFPMARGSWRVTAFGRNLTDQNFAQTALGVAGLFSFAGAYPPRTWGVELQATF